MVSTRTTSGGPYDGHTGAHVSRPERVASCPARPGRGASRRTPSRPRFASSLANTTPRQWSRRSSAAGAPVANAVGPAPGRPRPRAEPCAAIRSASASARRTDLVGCHHRVDEPDLVGPLGRDGCRSWSSPGRPPAGSAGRSPYLRRRGTGRGEPPGSPNWAAATRRSGRTPTAAPDRRPPRWRWRRRRGERYLAVEQPVVRRRGPPVRWRSSTRRRRTPGGPCPAQKARSPVPGEHHRAHVGIRLGRDERGAERLEQRPSRALRASGRFSRSDQDVARAARGPGPRRPSAHDP